MVVTRKTPVAPVPAASRTNSSQTLPRAAKPKSTSSLAERETEAAQAAAKNAAAATSPKPHPKSKHKNRHHKKPEKASSGWLDRLVYLFLSLLALYSFTTCPYDTALSNPVCRSLSLYRVHVLEPFVLPPIYRTLEHPSVAPYVEKAQHIERTALRPVYKKSAPYVTAAKRAVWDRTVVPAFYVYVAPQYRKHVLPQWRKHVVPHIARVAPYAARAQHTLERTAFVLHKTYSTRVAPAISHAYMFSRPYVIQGYRTARPHVIAFYALVSDKAGTARRAYVDPHVVRIWEKVLELSGAGPVGSPTQQPVSAPVPEATAATTEDLTTEEVATKTTVKAAVTPVQIETSSSAAPSAENEVPVPSSTASVAAEAVETSSVVPAETSTSVVKTSTSQATAGNSVVLEELSAASIAIESAHGMASPVVQEILADVQSAEASTSIVQTPRSLVVEEISTGVQSADASTSVVQTSSPQITAEKSAVLEELSAASIAIESAHGMESPVVEEILAEVQSTPTSAAPSPTPESEPELSVEEQPEDDSDLLGFLEDIGLEKMFVDDSSDLGSDADEDTELTHEEIERLKQQEKEEQAAAKRRYNVEKRAEIEAKMAKSFETLGVMVKQKTKELRKTLVGLRKSAVSKMDDPQTEVGGAVPNLRKEGDKMLAGLEGYLKKEAKVNKGGNPVERTERWEKVVKKVEEKLGESVQQVQGILHVFHAAEKDEEVSDGMTLIQAVKDACTQAQADVGLDLSWLDDVTYQDWEVYHSLMKFAENFQAEASEIQRGTHKNPPVDPFLVRLEELQKALGDLVNELVGRIGTLRQQASKTFALEAVHEPPPAEETSVDAGEDGTEESENEDEAQEPEVSILPVPPAADPGVLDPAQVIIGKSAEQVNEALRIAEEHQEL